MIYIDHDIECGKNYEGIEESIGKLYSTVGSATKHRLNAEEEDEKEDENENENENEDEEQEEEEEE